MFDTRERESDRQWDTREDCKLRLAGENATLLRPLPGCHLPPRPSYTPPILSLLFPPSAASQPNAAATEFTIIIVRQAVHFRFAIWTRQTYIRPGAPLPGHLNKVPPLHIQDTRYAHTDIPAT